MDPSDRIEDCITVSILQDDLAYACTASCEGEPCDTASYLPKERPTTEEGTSFMPFDAPDREPSVAILPDSPVRLFQLFVPEFLVDSWVRWTNASPIPGPEGPPQQRSRKLDWKPTSVAEVYLFLGILLYMGIHKEATIESYWESSLSDKNARHYFSRFLTRDRFEILHRRLRIFDPALFETPQEQLQQRRRRGAQQPAEADEPKPYRQVNAWSKHIQQVSTDLYMPGNRLTIDECMVRFTGRSVETTTLPTKPIPVGYKVWVLAQAGYFLRWIWHVHNSGPVGLTVTARPQRQPTQGTQSTQGTQQSNGKDVIPITEVADFGRGLNPTQGVVIALLNLLQKATYHVFLDNLFPTPTLFRILREQQIGATGTCRMNSGIYKGFVTLKSTEGKGLPWGELRVMPTVDGQVNQFAWKDNALVLALSTVYEGTEYVIRSRRRPNARTAAGRAARQVFGSQPRKELPIPAFIDAYNHSMNGVDVGDQMRASLSTDHRVRRGGWQALAWNYLLEVIAVNTYILQLHGKPNWKPFTSQLTWRQELSSQLITTFGPQARTRKRARTGLPSDNWNESIPFEQHEHINRGRNKGSSCVVCGRCPKRRRVALGEIAGNRQEQRTKTRWGCRQCNVAICTSGLCWYIFHKQK